MHGITVGVEANSNADAECALKKIESAANLVAEHDPRRWRRLLDHADGVLVFGTVGSLGFYIDSVKLIVLQMTYVQDSSTSAADIASVLVHESTHAWLFSQGIGYPEHLRPRIEAVCFKSEIEFAKKLPDPGDLIAKAQRQLNRDPRIWTTAGELDTAAHNLRELGVPRILVAALREFARIVRRA